MSYLSLKNYQVSEIPNYFELKHINNVRSLYSNEEIPSQTRIVQIPLNNIISYKVAIASSTLLRKIYKKLKNSRKQHIILSLYLAQYMENKDNKNNKFKSYFDILPKDLDNIPIFWTGEDLKYLKGSPFLSMIEHRNKIFTDEFEEISSHVEPGELDLLFIGYEDDKLKRYKFTRSLVSSRNFSITVDLENLNVLVPIADMINHRNIPLTRWGFENGIFFVDTTETIPIHTEITDSYGTKSNYLYLLYYGFTIFSPNSLIRNLDSVDIELNELSITLTLPFSEHTLNQMLDEMGRSKTTKSKKRKLYYINKKLISLLDGYHLLQSYKKTHELLESGTLSSNQYNALVIIYGEKKVLQTYIENIFEIIN